MGDSASAQEVRSDRSMSVNKTDKVVSLVAMILIIASLRLVRTTNFTFVFSDEGSNLTVQYLISHGLVPLVDFGYQYGLLPLLIGKVWFRFFGLNARAYGFAVLTCSLLVGFALWRASFSLRFNLISKAFIVITIGWAIGQYPNFAHALEAALISNALAEQAAGRMSSAMALSLIAALVKPSMSYVYFSVLLGSFVFNSIQEKDFLRKAALLILPAWVAFGSVVRLLT